MNFRVSDLQVLLGFAGRNKTGKKQELQYRALDLLKLKSSAVEMKIRELHNRRYHHQLTRPNSYEMPEPPAVVERPPAHRYEAHVNNNYPARFNPNVRPTPHHQQGPSSSSYSSSSKAYLVPNPSNTNSHQRYNTYASVKFKDLPFYDNMYCLMQPFSLPTEGTDRFQETTFYFTLTPQQAQEVAMSRSASGHYECQILLRFCLLDTSCEQEDYFPQNAAVKLNTKNVPLPNPVPLNRPGVEPKRPSKPVNITPYSKLSPTVTNIVTVSWTSTYGRSFAVGLFIARQLTSITLLQRLKNNGVRNPDYTTAMIKEKLQQGQDADIATTSLRGSLICPLGKIRMDLPCRAITCTHLQCFDAHLYIQMNEKKPKWICPVCDKPAPFKNLALDGLIIDIAGKVPPDCTEVQFYEDGSWTPVEPVKEQKEKKAVEKKKANKSVEIVDILSDSDSEEAWSYELDQNAVKTALGSDSPPVSQNSLFLPPSEPFPTAASQSFSNMQMPIDNQNDVNDSVCILPDQPTDANDSVCIIPNDLVSSNVDTSMPSTSSSSPGLNSASFPQIPFLTDSYYPSDPTNGTQSTTSYNSFDFLSLLQIPDVEPQKGKEYSERKDTSTPDVISLD